MPAACDQAAVDAFLRCFFVDVVGQGHVASAEIEDFLLIDEDRSKLVHGAGNVVFKVTILRRMMKTALPHVAYERTWGSAAGQDCNYPFFHFLTFLNIASFCP